MKIFVQGLWHCGCVISACLASLKNNVTAYDDNKKNSHFSYAIKKGA